MHKQIVLLKATIHGRHVARGGAWGAQAPPSFLITFFLKMIFNKIEFVWHVLSKYGSAKTHNAAS